MKAMVLYDSVYGNTEQVAQAIGQALGDPETVTMRRVKDVQAGDLSGVEILVVGSPTQKFSPLPSTTQFLKGLAADSLRGVKVAAFDTRISQAEVDKHGVLAFFVKLFGYAAEPIAKRLEKAGGTLVIPPEGFYVGGTEGPLLEGELERAAGWARQIAAAA